MKLKTSSFERKLKSITPSSIKKILVYFLVNGFFGKAIKSLNLRWNLFGGVFNYSLVSDIEAAKIFWGIWESAEIRFSKRFANTNIIVELGSSIGVTLCVLSNIRSQTKFICIEASSENFKKLSLLKKSLSNKNEYILINKAVAYGVENIGFEFSTTTGSKINKSLTNNNFLIPAITLNQILINNNISEEYTLITDIEGAEADIFFKDKAALKNCSCIIAELENTKNYSIDDQIQRLTGLGFSIIERYGSVVVMQRS